MGGGGAAWSGVAGPGAMRPLVYSRWGGGKQMHGGRGGRRAVQLAELERGDGARGHEAPCLQQGHERSPPSITGPWSA